MDYGERGRLDAERVRRERHDTDSSRAEREKRRRTDRDRWDRDGEERDHSRSRMEVGRERRRSDRDERRHRGRDYSGEEEGREFSRAKDREIARTVEDRDLARDKESSRNEKSRELPGRARERESSRGDKDSERSARVVLSDDDVELSRARSGEFVGKVERGGSHRGRERESPRRGSRSRRESSRGAGRGGIEFKVEELVEDDGKERGRWLRRPRESSPDGGDIETAKGKGNESPEQRRVRPRMDSEADREAEAEEDGDRRRGKVRKDRDYSDEDDRSRRRRINDDRTASMDQSRRATAGASAGPLGEDALILSLELRTGNEKQTRFDTAEIALRNAPEKSVGILSKTVGEEKEKAVLEMNREDQPRRIASPSPTTKPHLPSASESESGDSDSSRSASPDMSLTPDRATFTKPTRATPDIRRRERSPNPSPLSPRSRLPPPGGLGALSPIVPSKLAEEASSLDGGRGVGDNLNPSSENGGDMKLDVEEGEHTLEDGEALDRWVPGNDAEELRSYRLADRERGDRRGDGEDFNGRQDESMQDAATYGSGRGRYGDPGRHRGDLMPTSRERDLDANRQRNAYNQERRVQREGERDGYRREVESIVKNRERGRELRAVVGRGGNGTASPVDNDRHTRSDRWEGRLTDRERRDSRRGDRGDFNGRQDESMQDGATYGSGRGRYGDPGRHRGDLMPTSKERDLDTNRQRNASNQERRVQREGEREGYHREVESIVKHRESSRESDRRKVVNGDSARSNQEKLAPVKLGDKGEAAAEMKKVERERPQLPAGRSGGVYIPPFKLAQMLREVDDKSSNEYQRLTWDALRKSINGLVNKVNASNLKNILPELFSENLIRGRGLFARSCMKSQMASPTFTHVFAALVAVVNTKFPELGELLLKRIILQLRRAFKRNDKPVLLAAAKFIAHLVNQQVAHEILALELLTVLLENPTDDSVEVAVGFVKECGATLQNLSSQGLHAIFERFRGILHEGEIDKRVQFMIEGLFAIRKANFQGYAGVLPELDLVEQEDQITHELSLEDDLDDESYLDVFKPDPNFVESEKKYEALKKDILGDDSEEEGVEDGDKDDEEEESDEEDEEDEDEREQRMQIQDETETNLVNLRRTIYLTIMSSVDFEEAGHKLLKIKLEPGQEMELCIMLLECCSQERTYLRYYGLLGQRFCMINRVYQENFDQCFVKQYSMIHRLETNKLRNVAKFFAHLLGTDALPWQALAYIRLTEEDTTSSSRIFIKILFQELSEHLGLRKLNERLSDPVMQESFDGIFPKDNPKNTRFAINFFTSIGLGGLTDSLREYLKNMPRLIMQQHPALPSETEESSSLDGDGSDSSSDSDSDTVSDSSSDSDSEDKKRRKKKHR